MRIVYVCVCVCVCDENERRKQPKQLHRQRKITIYYNSQYTLGGTDEGHCRVEGIAEQMNRRLYTHSPCPAIKTIPGDGCFMPANVKAGRMKASKVTVLCALVLSSAFVLIFCDEFLMSHHFSSPFPGFEQFG